MQNTILAISFVLASWPCVLSAQGLPALYDVTGVAAYDVLNVRAQPIESGELLDRLAPDAQAIEITALAKNGTWGRLNLGERSGWVSMRFMTKQDRLPWTNMSGNILCYGTEPDWGLAIHGEQKKMTFTSTFTDIDDNDFKIIESSTANQIPGVVGIVMEGAEGSGFATITATECSDGMSDRSFGLSSSIFIRDNQKVLLGYSGCCSVLP